MKCPHCNTVFIPQPVKVMPIEELKQKAWKYIYDNMFVNWKPSRHKSTFQEGPQCILNRDQTDPTRVCRQFVCWYLYNHLGMLAKEIAPLVGLTNITTVCHNVRKFQDALGLKVGNIEKDLYLNVIG